MSDVIGIVFAALPLVFAVGWLYWQWRRLGR
jgi:hypothetical protein